MHSWDFRPNLRNCALGTSATWSSVVPSMIHYFCCMLAGNANFVRNNPIATKRVLGAILKAADLCATEPKRVAQQIVDAGLSQRYDYAVQAMNDVPYNKWREYDP